MNRDTPRQRLNSAAVAFLVNEALYDRQFSFYDGLLTPLSGTGWACVTEHLNEVCRSDEYVAQHGTSGWCLEVEARWDDLNHELALLWLNTLGPPGLHLRTSEAGPPLWQLGGVTAMRSLEGFTKWWNAENSEFEIAFNPIAPIRPSIDAHPPGVL